MLAEGVIASFVFRRFSHASYLSPTPVGVYANRTVGRHRDHRGFDRPAAAGRAEGARGGIPREMSEQLEAARPGLAFVPRRQRWFPARPRHDAVDLLAAVRAAVH